ncbi:MAG: chemotaxis protein CheX [Bdellovibrionales bacterium]|nr:chemotaxis protein CheX [Bdellovibrionales bacterium]
MLNVESFKDTLTQVTARVLEDWAMMLVEPADSVPEIFGDNDRCFCSSIRYRGVFNGVYSIVCPPGFLEVLASNVLGSEDEIEDDDRLDALREMANVLCGNLLTEMYGEDPVFDVVMPRIRELPSSEIGEFFSERTICFLADDEPIAITYSMEASDAD